MKNYRLNLEVSVNTSHQKIISRINPNSRVLELGTARGHMTKYLKEVLNCEIFGVEINKEMLKDAKKFLKRAICKDLNRINKWKSKLKNNYFDYIILGDVLEHLYNPIKILQELYIKLKKDGKIIISIPNVSHNAIIMELLENNFSYCKTGLLDDTHIRFFTQTSFIKEIENLNYKLLEYDFTYMVPLHSILKKDYLNYSIFEREALINHRDSHIFQNIFVLGKNEAYKMTPKIEIQENLFKQYDEFILKFQLGEKRFFLDRLSEKMEYLFCKDEKLIEIIPTIRLRKYKLQIFKNGNLVDINMIQVINGISDGNGSFIPLSNHRLLVDEKFVVNDKIEIIVEYEELRLDEILKKAFIQEFARG